MAKRQACIQAIKPTFYGPSKPAKSRAHTVMSEPEEQPKLDLDLGTAFLPSWAQKSAKENPYAKFQGRDNERSGRRDSRRSDRFDRSGGGGGGQRQGDRRRPSGNRDSQRKPARSGDSKGRPPAQTQPGAAAPPRRGGRPGGQERGGRPQRPRHRSRQEIIASLPGLKVSIIPDQKGVESLAKQIRMQGRAYPLFDIATLVLKRPDRFKISTTLQADGKGQPVSEQWKCLIDDTLWLSQSEAIAHILGEHFDQFYERQKTETNPPKGNFSFVAQCGISGKILGPPNYHGYQDALRALHAERFERMHFDAFKERVRIVREEEVVKKWIDEQSWKTEFKSKLRPDEAPIDSWDNLVEDFKTHHLKGNLETSKTLTISAAAGLKTPSRSVQELIRFHVEDQRRFPLQVATILSQMFARQGLQFFKVNKTITHVSVARPKYLDMNETPVSEGVEKIVEFVEATPDCNRKKLFDALRSSGAASASVEPKADEPQAKEKPSTEPNKEETETKSASGEPEEQAATSQEQPSAPVSAEDTAIITDLHWLIHQGHVIEFSNGKMETAKKPAPRTEKSEKTSKGSSSGAASNKKSKPANETQAAPASKAAAPEAAAPEAAAPEAAAPETAAPEAAAPEAAAPETAAPEAAAPETAAPETAAPEAAAPEAAAKATPDESSSKEANGTSTANPAQAD